MKIQTAKHIPKNWKPGNARAIAQWMCKLKKYNTQNTNTMETNTIKAHQAIDKLRHALHKRDQKKINACVSQAKNVNWRAAQDHLVAEISLLMNGANEINRDLDTLTFTMKARALLNERRQVNMLQSIMNNQ